MKKLIFILILFISFKGFSQSLYVPNNPDSIKVPVNVNGAIRTVYVIDLVKNAKFDTTALHQQLVDHLAAIQANASAITLKQNQLNGTGFVKANGTTISYDNTNYISDTSGLHAQIVAVNNALGTKLNTVDTLNKWLPKNTVIPAAIDTGSLDKRIIANASAITLKQNQLNGTGFVKASGTTISYDNTSYVSDTSALHNNKVDKWTTIKINGVTKDLSGNQDWGTIGGGSGASIPRLYNVKDYGAVGDGITNDKSAIQATINACNAAGGGIVYLPNGVYYLGSGTDAQSGAQLYLPLSSYNRTDTARVIKLLGETPPNMYSNPISDATAQKPPQTGVVLLSGLTSSASIIGSRSETVSWGLFNFAGLSMENITIRSKSKSGNTQIAPQDTAVNAYKIAYLEMENVRVDTESPTDSTVQPLTTSIGILAPAVNNFGFVNLHKVLVEGYYDAIKVTEHAEINETLIDGCYNGIVFLAAHHSSHVNKVVIARTKNTLKIEGGCTFSIDNLSIEANTNSATARWSLFNADLIEPANNGSKGLINFIKIISGGTTSTTWVRPSPGTTTIQIIPIGNPSMVMDSIPLTIRTTAATTPASGSGLEMLFNGGGVLQPYNRTTSQYLPLAIISDPMELRSASAVNINTPSIATNQSVTYSSSGSLTLSGASGVLGQNISFTGVRSTGNYNYTSGSGMELQYSGSAGILQAYNRTSSTFLPMNIRSSTIGFNSGSAATLAATISANQNLLIGTATDNSRLTVAGSVAFGYVAKTAAYTATDLDYTIDCNGTFTITLRSAVGITGRIYVIKNSGSGTITMAGTSSQTFDGNTSPTIAAGSVSQYQSNGANWIKIN